MTKDTIQKYVIVDTDMGTDDAWALLMLLKAEKCLKNIKILAITCVSGNTNMENVIKNTYYMLHGVGRTDVSFFFCKSKSNKVVHLHIRTDSNLQRCNGGFGKSSLGIQSISWRKWNGRCRFLASRYFSK